MARKYRIKKIFTDTQNNNYVLCRLYDNLQDMQDYYWKRESENDQMYVLGVHLAYDKFKVDKNGKETFSNERGTVLLCHEHCGAGIVAHEFGHAVLWAWKNNNEKYKKQYPIKIKNMKEEEEILHNQTHAISQFYQWYWKLK